jgi:hypothetical protein
MEYHGMKWAVNGTPWFDDGPTMPRKVRPTAGSTLIQ